MACKDCGHRFRAESGGGFSFHLLRCDRCGKTKSIGFAELGDVHLGYLKGLPGPYCVASSEHDHEVQERYPGRPLSERAYERKVQEFAGACGCGGRFRFRARVRCPKCRSTRLEATPGSMMLYD